MIGLTCIRVSNGYSLEFLKPELQQNLKNIVQQLKIECKYIVNKQLSGLITPIQNTVIKFIFIGFNIDCNFIYPLMGERIYSDN